MHARGTACYVECCLSWKISALLKHALWDAAQIEAADAAAISGWIGFIEELGGAYLAAVRRWVEAHAAAAEGKDPTPDPNPSPTARAALDALPGPRLLCDNLFTSEMREVRSSGLDTGLDLAPCICLHRTALRARTLAAVHVSELGIKPRLPPGSASLQHHLLHLLLACCAFLSVRTTA